MLFLSAMKIIQVIFLVLVLAAPIGVSSTLVFGDDEQQCELLESFGEEEEGDDTESKDFEESELLKDFDRSDIDGFFYDESEFRLYLEHHPNLSSIELEVQTPPPENTNC